MITKFRGRYAFLSNFYDTEFNYDGCSYMNVETAFQAQKTFDMQERFKLRIMSASEAKKAGHKVQLRSDWEEKKVAIMYDIVYAKFSQNDSLKKALLATKNEELVEDNSWGDTFWGQVNGKGENMLGKILMGVRQSLYMTELIRLSTISKVF